MPVSIAMQLRLPPDLHRWIVEEAARQHRPAANLALALLLEARCQIDAERESRAEGGNGTPAPREVTHIGRP